MHTISPSMKSSTRLHSLRINTRHYVSCITLMAFALFSLEAQTLDAFAPAVTTRASHRLTHQSSIQTVSSSPLSFQFPLVASSSRIYSSTSLLDTVSLIPDLTALSQQLSTVPIVDLALDIFDKEPDPFQYAFMFPITTCVAVLCQSAGIGGAALLSPIFLLIFPLLGPQYPLESAAASIASALLTECFGFLSGLSGFMKCGLVDWGVAAKFIAVSVPASLAGALIEPSLSAETTLLRAVYATLMIGLCVFLTVSEKAQEIPDDCPIPEGDEDDEFRTQTAADGTVYTYLQPSNQQNWKTKSATISGATLTGLLGVGIGEVILPQLVRLSCMPLPVAAGTSVAVVVITALTAALVQFGGLAHELMMTNSNIGMSLPDAVLLVIPWSLVQFTVPGAILGGQIAPRLAANRVLDEDQVENVVAVLFGIIGLAFGVKSIVG
jgi:uncharacterized membrane protein YfcA